MGYCNKRSEYNELSIITVSIIILNNKNKFNNSVIIYIVYNTWYFVLSYRILIGYC